MLAFYNRIHEIKRLDRFLGQAQGGLAVVYGRRRCGKSTLIKRVLGKPPVYFLADQREAHLQREALAVVINASLPGFSRATYPGWPDFLEAIYDRLSEEITICIDEFPYLVETSPSLPSVLQGFLDRSDQPVKWILCGSSQRMMQGLVLDRRAPLYGRAREILRVQPLAAGWIRRALACGADEAIEAYSVWGGIPRYWELASEFRHTEEALRDLVWDYQGVLHEEPMRLLLDDMRSAMQPYSVLSLIGQGCHRPSEIAARSGLPITRLSRPLTQLCELGYVRRDIPFGEHPRKTRSSLYRLDDSFMRFYFRFVLPFHSGLAQDFPDEAMNEWRTHKGHFVGGSWEHLARLSVPHWVGGGEAWGVAGGWWSRSGQAPEIDVVAVSIDKKSLLLGECKWATGKKPVDLCGIDARLRSAAHTLPFARGKKIVTACWIPEQAKTSGKIDLLARSGDVLEAGAAMK